MQNRLLGGGVPIMMKRNIVLVGMMGSGKSHIGRKLAQRLNWQFVDTDRRIERAVA